jgi:hypothetical protein
MLKSYKVSNNKLMNSSCSLENSHLMKDEAKARMISSLLRRNNMATQLMDSFITFLIEKPSLLGTEQTDW